MTKKIIYYGFSDIHRIKIIDYLHEQHKWKPTYFTGNNVSSLKQSLLSKYDDLVFEEALELRKGKFDYSKFRKIHPIDSKVLRNLEHYQLNFLCFLQDTTGWNFSIFERREFYYDILKYWNTVLSELKPDLIVFFTRPHASSCHSLYLLAKYNFNIPVLYIDPVPFFNKGYHFIGNSLEKLYSPFVEHYATSELHELHSDVKNYLTKLKSDSAEIPVHIQNAYKKDRRHSFKILKSFTQYILKPEKIGQAFKISLVDWKKNQRPYQTDESRFTNLGYLLFLFTLKRRNKRLEKIYLGKTVNVNLGEKYIYFAAPYQPEAVSSINGGVYDDITLALDMLSNAIPTDWYIYYKEHPGTFMQGNKGCLRRSRFFYEKLEGYTNVKLVSPATSTFNLIDKSKAVCSIAGTVSWESAVRGKPSISFGSAWYNACKSIFHVETFDELKFAIERIINGFKPDEKDVEKYASAIHKVCIKNMLHRDFKKTVKRCNNVNEEMKRIGNAIHEAHELIQARIKFDINNV